MPGFAESFWSPDLAGGLGVLFEKLQQGVVENQQVLTIARMRADAEEQYGRKLADITTAVDKMAGRGFGRDDGASLRKAYEGVRTEMFEASKNHKKIASNINELVVIPFSRWCGAHESRVQGSQDDLQARLKTMDRQNESVKKLRDMYWNKCLQLEDIEEENKLAFQAPEKSEPSSPKPKTPTIKLPEEEETAPVEIGDDVYQPDQVKKILTHMLNNIKTGETKVAILGTYQNVSTGADIVDYLQKEMGATTVSYAERIGQDLVTNGFLRLVGNVGNSFTNSSRWYYQWRPKVFQITGLPQSKKIERVSSIGTDSSDSPTVGSMGEILQTWNPLNNPHPNETLFERIQRESREADERYKSAVKKLDLVRCNLEEAMIDHLRFMERCELDRLKAIKAVMLDFSGAISNAIPGLQSSVDNMMLYQETVQPDGDLRYLLENYRTGGFVPRAPVYENYYHSVDEQTFGVDLEARARHDRKRVPTIITTILMFLDSHYPDLEGDVTRRSIWTVEVPLAATHHLRNAINNGRQVPREILERYEIPIVASVLKLYFLELPDSLVSSQVYEIIKTIYSSPDSSDKAETRVQVLQNTLGQLRLANIATLDAITTHFTRLIELTSADEPFIAHLAQVLAPCILRPKTESALTLHERHPYRLVRDLFDHRETIFGELKRASSQSQPASQSKPRDRAPNSTDESNRRANEEERHRAIANRSRNPSPSPGQNGVNGRSHRRERSVGSSGTRFPIIASPPAITDPAKRAARHSLDVPPEREVHSSPSTGAGKEESMPVTAPEKRSKSARDETPVLSANFNGSTPDDGTNPLIEKKTPSGRTGHVNAMANRLNRKTPSSGSGSGLGMLSRQALKRDSVSSIEQQKRDSQVSNESDLHRGIELTDKPMFD